MANKIQNFINYFRSSLVSTVTQLRKDRTIQLNNKSSTNETNVSITCNTNLLEMLSSNHKRKNKNGSGMTPTIYVHIQMDGFVKKYREIITEHKHD